MSKDMKSPGRRAFRFEPEMYERMRAAAAAENRSVSNYLENVIKRALDAAEAKRT